MIFWIGVIIAIALAFYLWLTDEAGWFGALLLGALTGLGAAVIIGGIATAATGSFKTQEEYRVPLKALAASQSVEGHFFLGSGSVNGKRTINYITADGNRNYLQEADASRSTVIEDTPVAAGPHLTAFNQCMNNPWIAPWQMCRPLNADERSMEFHIPAGSVLSDYTVDNK